MLVTTVVLVMMKTETSICFPKDREKDVHKGWPILNRLSSCNRAILNGLCWRPKGKHRASWILALCSDHYFIAHNFLICQLVNRLHNWYNRFFLSQIQKRKIYFVTHSILLCYNTWRREHPLGENGSKVKLEHCSQSYPQGCRSSASKQWLKTRPSTLSLVTAQICQVTVLLESWFSHC